MSYELDEKQLAAMMQKHVAESLKVEVEAALHKITDVIVKDAAEKLTRSVIAQVRAKKDFASNGITFLFSFDGEISRELKETPNANN